MTYLLDAQGQEVECVIGGRLNLTGLNEGMYMIVIDGFHGPSNAGSITVNINSPNVSRSNECEICPNECELAG